MKGSQRDICTPMFIAGLCKEPRHGNSLCPAAAEWLKEMWYTHKQWNTSQPRERKKSGLVH